jgi:hypothetical protein
MNKEQQRIAIAEACGWKRHADGLGYYQGVHPAFMGGRAVPDYLNDLNAMHEAEKVLLTKDGFCGCWETYSNILTASMGCTDIFHATAAQRAEAFLKTLGLWEEGE